MDNLTPELCAKLYPVKTAEASVIEKDWAAGTKASCESTELVINPDGTSKVKAVNYPPSWLKMIDEPIVNALDQMIKTVGGSYPVTEIKITFTPERVSIENNGQGIPAVMHKTAGVYLPHFFLGMLYQSGNHNKTEGTADDLVGGVNGFGAKITNLLSKRFTVETVHADKTSSTFYMQQWTDHMANASEPKIYEFSKSKPLPAVIANRGYPHTTITFEPDLSHFSCEDPAKRQDWPAVVYTRAALASAYAIGHGAAVWFNGVKLPHTMQSLAQAVSKQTFRAVLKSTHSVYKYPWEVVIGYGGDPVRASIINGIVVRDGKHIKIIEDQIVEAVRAKIIKSFEDKSTKFQPGYVKKNISIWISAQIPQPKWEGQRKDTFVIDDVRKLAGYVIPPAVLSQVATALQEPLLEIIFGNQIKELTSKPPPKTTYEKYWPARMCGSKPQLCTLLVLEGDSPANAVRDGLNNTIGMDYFGVMSTGGVIINVRKESTAVETTTGRFINQTRKLKDNKFINAWYEITGMSPYFKYDPASPTYKREISRLRYRRFVFFTDQDYDGIGNIDPLLLNFVRLWFPNLCAAGYFHFFETPRTRVWIGHTIHEFYSDETLAAFLRDRKPTAVKYYKGIGSHNKDQLKRIIKGATSHIVPYIFDPDTDQTLERFYGVDTQPRKDELSRPMSITAADVTKERASLGGLTVSTHIKFDAGQFQRDNIDRKLISAIDGFNQSSRMIYNTCKDISRAMVVSALAGVVLSNENYAHGQSSLEGNIQGWALIAPGARQIPLFFPWGHYGSRTCGGASAASPRYTSAQFITVWHDIIPADDLELLEYNYDEGRRCEPKYFVPIIPMAILDNNQQPSHGWKICVYARDALQTINMVRWRLDNPTRRLPPGVLRLATTGWTGSVRIISGKPQSVGRYEVINSRCIRITELPFGVWTDNWLAKLKERNEKFPMVADIANASAGIIDITIQLIEDISALSAWATWYTDGVEEYFMLRKTIRPYLNMVGDQKQVIEFEHYEDVFEYWFKFRAELYTKRVARSIIRTNARIIYYENLIRFVESGPVLATKTIGAMLAKLSEDNYTKINKQLALGKSYTPTDELNVEIFGESASFDYLIDLTDRKRSKEALTEYRAALDRERAAAVQLNKPNADVDLWRAELNRVEQGIREGFATDWKFSRVVEKYADE